MGGTFGARLRAFHMAANVTAARSTLSGFYRGPQQRHLHEWHGLIEPADIPELHEKKKQRRGILEARHDGLRRELDQRAELDDAEQSLQRSAEENDRERHSEHQRDSAGRDFWLFGMNQAIDQDAEEESRVDTGRVDRRRLVAKRHTNHGHDQRSGQAGDRAVGEIALAQRREGEHSVAHRQRNGDCRGNESADHVDAQMPQPVRHGAPTAMVPRELEHDPQKWKAAFGKDHAPT
jgi:hypothetical protein